MITLNGDLLIIKQAGLLDNIVSGVKSYVSSHIDPNHKAKSLFDLLAPGAISVAFSSMGLGWMGLLVGYALRTFNINVSDIFSSIWGELKPLIEGDKQVSSNQVESIVHSAVQQNAGADLHTGSEQLLRDAQFLKLALEQYQRDSLLLTKIPMYKQAGALSTKAGTSSVLARILSVIFKIALTSAGLMIAGDATHKLYNSVSGQQSASTNQSALKPATESGWSLPIENEPYAIKQKLLELAHLQASDPLPPNFNKVMSEIIWYNHAAEGDKIVLMPPAYPNQQALLSAIQGTSS